MLQFEEDHESDSAETSGNQCHRQHLKVEIAKFDAEMETLTSSKISKMNGSKQLADLEKIKFKRTIDIRDFAVRLTPGLYFSSFPVATF